MKKILYPILFLFLSCKNDNLNFLDATEEGLTVEAYVEEGKAPIVYLTTGLPINGFKEIDFLKSIESTAKVEINGNKQHEIATFSKDNSRFPSRFYGFNEFKGKVDEFYELKITIGDKIYTANTKVPKKPVISNVTVVDESTLKDGLYNLKIDIENPKTDSYYKFYIKKEGDDIYKKASVFVLSNELIDSTVLTVYNDFREKKEDNKWISLLENNQSYNLRVVAITKEEFLFWDRIFVSQTQIFNLPSLAQEVPTNISNNGFGFFSGNAEVVTTITINN